MTSKAKWATPDRQTCLVNLFLRSQGFCVYGHRPCSIPEHHYEIYAEILIRDWIADDKAQALAQWQAERKALHATNDRRYPVAGQFSGVAKDVFYDRQPEYYLVALGMSGLTLKPFAKVRIASSYMSLHVEIDLSHFLKGTSKNEKRKALRYGKVTETIRVKVNEAVRHYLSH